MSDTEHEIEKKILVSPAEMEAVYKKLSKDAVGGKLKTKHRPRAYYDTKKHRLQEQKMALRVQYKEGVGYEQTLKYQVAGDDDAVMSRVEVKDVLGEKLQEPNLALIDDKEAKKRLTGLEGKKLRHIFTADVHRRYFSIPVVVAGEEVGIVELAFDKGAVTHAKDSNRRVKISEIEVELKSGDPAAVDIMCQKILDMAPGAEMSAVSKAEFGYGLDDERRAEKQQKKAAKEAAKTAKKQLKDAARETPKKPNPSPGP
ncbi:MAG: CYTH domain-containing protein [Alphaproteobacteria bacterium]|nr:MAG: CYTH domain-containing protein [Alphaproteobacteria bacterium]